MKSILKKILPYTILLISISSILQWCSLPIGNTFVWWILQSFILYILIKLKPNKYHILPIKLFLIYLMGSTLYGAFFMAENYWDWKLLINNLMTFSLAFVAYTYSVPSLLASTLKYWFKYAWIILFLLIPFLASDAYGRFLVPFTILALCFPLLTKKYIILTFIAYIITIILGIQSRSDIIKFTITLLLGISLIIIPQLWKSKKRIQFIMNTLMIIPIILFTLGATGVFNIFKIEEELNLKDTYTMTSEYGNEYSALVDTRTGLYVEEIESAINNDYVIYGRSIARGYDSQLFGESINELTQTQRGERGSCETSILNIFNYFGLIGIFIYMFIFWKAAYLAISHSNNSFLPVIGIYVAFRWLFAWIEDFSRFDLNYMFLWILIGICYSPIYRKMTNQEFKQLFNLILK